MRHRQPLEIATRASRIAAVLVLLIVLSLFTPKAAWAKDKDEPKWIEVHTAHFSVITDAGEKRGREVALRMEQISNGVFRVNPGSLLPALSRMERAGHVKTDWRTSENNRRAKYYVITKRGSKALEEEQQLWGHQTAAITRILEA